MQLLALLKVLSMAYLLGALGLSLACLIWSLTRPLIAAQHRASTGFLIISAAMLLNLGLAVAIWSGVVTHHIRMTTNYFASLMYGSGAQAIIIFSTCVLAGSLGLAWYGWRRGRAHCALHKQRLDWRGNTLITSNALATAGLVGAWHPELWVNPAYWTSLTPKQKDLVVFHEGMHRARHDNLRKLGLQWIAALYGLLPWLRSWPQRFELDCELAVDDACRQQMDEAVYGRLIADAVQFLLPRQAEPNIVATRLTEADLRSRLQVLSHPRQQMPAWINPAVVFVGVSSSALPGLVLLLHPTLRCFLACYLGY